MKRNRRLPSLMAISIRIGVFGFVLWFLLAAIITLGTAQYVLRELCNNGMELAENVYHIGMFDFIFAADPAARIRRELPGVTEYSMNRAIASARSNILSPTYEGYPQLEDHLSVFNDEAVPCETAVVFTDAEGNILRQSGDYLYFGYIPQQQWQAGSDVTCAYGWIDISDESDPRYQIFRIGYAQNADLNDLDTIRITGYVDDSRFEPLSMALLTREMYYRAMDAACYGWNDTGPSDAFEYTVSEEGTSATVSASGGYEQPPYSLGELDAMGLLDWDVRFDHTESADPQKTPITIYARDVQMNRYEADGPVRYQKTEEHENLLALLNTMSYYRDKGRDAFYAGASQFGLWNMVVFSSWNIYDLRDYNSMSGEPFPDAQYHIMTAMRASPLKISMRFLRNIYWITFAIAVLGVLVVRDSIKANLILPLQTMNTGMQEGWTHLFKLVEQAPRWREPFELWENYQKTQYSLQVRKNEITRLNTALSYAKNAEQTRRRMTSNIAHELKTPLAVIHSYAEGLKAHIAEEKREKYLDVILTESERTDAMVLEMLDLSRLEAGRIRLSRDDFSLTELTKATFDRLERTARDKALNVSFDFPEECTVTADEGRIAQVIENFASNAVKYTPAGGNIAVRIRSSHGKTSFAMENDGPPFSTETLSRIWDAFYRADEARSGQGTGLGLSIAKSIVELHGGSCSARNTETGVEFSFVLVN